jgi:modification target Cys-rich repeat protein
MAAMALAVLSMTACPGGLPSKPDVPDRPGGSSTVNPNTCGNYAASDVGRRLKAFLQATIKLRDAVVNLENYFKDTCKLMGKELGISPDGDTREVCSAVAESLKEHLSVGLKAGASLDLKYEPAVCTVNIEAAASAAAKCEAKAEADIAVTCSGSCSGTCEGTCEGACDGKAGTDGGSGQCSGTCEGTCKGSCTGGCEGHADVEASVECEAHAEVYANVEAECTEPKVEIEIAAEVIADTSKLEAAKKAVAVGMPRILKIKAKATGPIKAAFATWAISAKKLGDSATSAAASLGDQATCVAGQLRGALGLLGEIQLSVSVQVEVSASVSGSASGGGGV